MVTTERHLPAKIGVIGDVHAESSFLKVVLTFLQDCHFQTIMCVGDIVDGRGSVDVCCELIQQYGVITVRGNRDRWFLANETRQLPEATLPKHVNQCSVEFIANLPVTREFKTLAGDLLLCHGISTNDMGRVTPADFGYAIESNMDLQELVHAHKYRFMINGHTHRSMVRSIGDLTIINAGTLKYDHDPCFLTVDFDSKMVQSYAVNEELVVSKSERFAL